MSTPVPVRPVLTRERVVAAAVELVDAHGAEALTMRAVAARLGSGVMSLYRHVADREELLDLVLGAMTAQVPVPEPSGDWRADLRATARAMRAALLRRPALTVLLTSRSGRGAGELPLLDHALGILRAAGLDARHAVLANHALGNLVAGAALWEAVGLGGPEDEGARDDRRAQLQAAADSAGLTNVDWAGAWLTTPDLDERFDAGLDLLLSGLEAWGADPAPAA